MTVPPLNPRSVWKPLAWWVVVFAVGQQAGTVFRFLGDVGDTRWADWVDLLTPWAVLGLGLVVVLRAEATGRLLLAYAAAGLLYVEGHALHLSANSISNIQSSGVGHLWDEVVSHYLWYSGALAVLVVLLFAVAGARDPERPWVGYALTPLLAFTLLNGWIEGGVVVVGFVSAAVLTALGVSHRRRAAGRFALTTGLLGLVALAGWGLYWGYFPQYSELGWI